MGDVIEILTTSTNAVEVIAQGPPGPPGPKGDPGDVAGLPLSTQGDTLYRGASQNERLAIGSTGQILKVSAQGLPTWANESGAVTSVNGQTGAVVLDAADVGAAETTHAAEHEAGEADEIKAMAALVATDVNALNGVYFFDGTTTGGRPNFFKTGTRKNTKLEYNTGNSQWKLIRNNVVEAVGVDGPNTVPWGHTWEELVTPTSVSVTRLPLETMVQKLAETGGAATATTSEDGLMSSADKTKLNGIASGAEVNVQANWTESNSASDAFILNKPSTFAPTAHAASHAAGGSDPLAPSDIGAQSIFTTELLAVTADQTLTAARAKNYAVQNYGSGPFNLTLPIANNLAGDVVVIRIGGTFVSDVVIRRQNYGSQGGGPQFTTLATLVGGGPSDQQYRFIKADSNDFAGWSLVPVDTHTHAASAITSGTLAHERGGLEADVSAYSGLVKISGGSTSAVGIGTGSTEVAAGDHVHGNLTSDGKLGNTAGLPVVTTTAGAVTTLALGTANQVLRVNSGATGVEFADPAASGVTGAASSASDVLGVSGSNITGVDANADRIVYWNNTSNKLAYGTPADAGAAAASHTHGTGDITGLAAIATSGSASDLGSGTVPIARLGASGTPSGSTYLAGDNTWKSVTGGISAVGASTADVLSVSGSDLVADDGGTIDSADPFIKWDDTNSKLVYANPLSRPSGAFYVGLAPTTTALGTNSVNIQSGRDNAAHVAKDASSVCVGYGARSTSSLATTIGHNASCGNGAFAGGGSASAGNDSIAVGFGATSGNSGAALGRSADCSGGVNSVAIGNSISTTLRAQFAVASFRAVYWSGQTTTNAATILNLDGTATNRFTIAASTALAVDILLVARRATTQDKWLVARRFLGIRRDGSNNTALIGAVQTLGTDQSAGSPTWTFALTADDTNEALQLEVTGATGETVEWRATAFYRVA